MRIIIDTDREQIIVPNTFYQQIDKRNDVLKKAGVEADKMIDYTKFVKDAFETAYAKPFIRKEDLSRR